MRSANVSPAKTRASSHPSSASRPIPTSDANTPITTVAAIRRRTPRVNCQSLESKNMKWGSFGEELEEEVVADPAPGHAQ